MKMRNWTCGLMMGMAMAWGFGCESDNSDGTPETNDAAETNPDAVETNAAASLTGIYTFKHETMELEQNGSSLTGGVVAAGFVQDPANPVQWPVPVVGSVDAEGVVQLQELLIYTLNPAQNYVIYKVGELVGSNKLVLAVTAGQKPQTQVWIRVSTDL